MRQPSRLGATRDALRPTPPAPLVRLDDPALQHRPMRIDALPDGNKPELIETAEDGQIGRVEGSVEHVGVFLGW